jgi:radical SAM superfamily enzyme YgiQ (UPF0313 family)
MNWENETEIKNIGGVLSAENKKILPFERRELSVLEDLPILGFDDFDMTLYSEEILPIMMSRGCVALCTFCDEPSYWGRFRFRSPEHIFRELKTNSTKYGINFFQSMDSLLNGHQ